MTSDPAITVIMPVYNRAHTVERALASVLRQTFGSFEFIVIDDGSTDGTAGLVERVRDDRIRLLRVGTHNGANAARNRGIKAARAPLLAFLDSDDQYLPNKLEVAVRAFGQRPEIDLLIDSFIKDYPAHMARDDVHCRNPNLDRNDDVLGALFTRRIWKATPGITVRRDVAIRAGRFDETLKRRQDFDFILRVARVGRCVSIDDILWVKSQSDDAISANLGDFAEAMLEFHRRHPQYLSHPAYRRGFAHDLGRHFIRLARGRRVGLLLRDGLLCARYLGLLRLLALFSEGAWRFHQRRKLANSQKPS